MCRRGTERIRFYFVSKNRAGLDLIAHALIGGRPKVGGAKQAEVFFGKDHVKVSEAEAGGGRHGGGCDDY